MWVIIRRGRGAGYPWVVVAHSPRLNTQTQRKHHLCHNRERAERIAAAFLELYL